MEEEFEDVAKFFKADEWNQTSSYEKLRYHTMFNNYKDMIESGFNVPKPSFMSNEEEDKPEIDEVADMEKKFKRKCVVESDMRKRAKLEEAAASKRYPKRNIPAKNYVEQAEIPEDRYVYCDECMHEHLDSCKEHTLIQVHDNPVPANKNNSNRARDTVPHGWVEVKESKIKDGGYGIWALRKIPKGIQFGPYEGVIGVDHTDGRYSWQIKKNGRVINYIDGFDTSISNWMRYVNCARNKEEQNLMAFQYRGKIFYRSVVEIQPHTELLVFYGAKFAKELGIDVKNYNSPPSNPFPEKVFKCENCYLIFCSPIYLEEHVARCTKKYVPIEDSNDSVTSDGRYECKPCSIIYTVKSLYDYHMKIKHPVYINPDERYPCSHCSMVFAIKSFYDRHLKSKHNDTINNGRSSTDSGLDSSSSMSNISTSTSEMDITEKKNSTNAGSRRFKRTVCLKAFTTNSYLKIHTRIHTGEKPYECNVCNKRFTRLGDLHSHERIHTGEKPYECNVCNKRFTVLQSLQWHTRIHTGEKPYECNVCNKRFTQLGPLHTHERIHTGEKPYECNVCNKRFTRLGHLHRHARIHTGEKPYECNVCNKRFTQLGHLHTHARIHTGEKPYECNVCNKRFTQLGHLHTHERIHTGEKPYECNVCNKRFTRLDHLHSHERIHTGEKPYVCNVCNTPFGDRRNLKNHKRKHEKLT